MNFAPTFADYQQFGQRSGDDKPPGTEEWWNSLTPEQQFQLIGGDLPLHQGDSRYQGFAGIAQPRPGSDIHVYGPGSTNFDGQFVDPNRVYHGDGVTAASWDNHSPQAQHVDNQGILRQFLTGAAMLVGGGLGANELFGFNGGTGLLGGVGTGVGEGVDLGGQLPLLTDGGGINAMDTGLVDSFGGGGLAEWDGNLGPNGGLDPETANGAGGMGVSQNGIGPGSFMDRLTGQITNPSHLFDSGTGLLSGLNPTTGSGLGNLLRIAGLGTSVAGLLHPNTNTNTNNNNSTPQGDKGGGGKGLDLSRGQYTPNPYTQQQVQNFRYTQPRGR